MTHLDPDMRQFLADLKRNNDREWFQDNKPRSEAARVDFESFVGVLLPKIEAFDPNVAGLDPKKCVFRIYRDTRFSGDKDSVQNQLRRSYADGRQQERSSAGGLFYSG